MRDKKLNSPMNIKRKFVFYLKKQFLNNSKMTLKIGFLMKNFEKLTLKAYSEI